MLVLKRSNCIDQPTLVGYDLRSQLVQRAESLFESSSIDDQLTHKIQETLQSLTADANNLPLFAGFPLSRLGRFDPNGLAHIFSGVRPRWLSASSLV